VLETAPHIKENSRRKFIQTFTAAAVVAVTAPLFSGPAVARGGPIYAASGESAAALSSVEITDLLFSLDGEKVARDVYIALYNMWRHNTFDSISASEQQHMDTMLQN